MADRFDGDPKITMEQEGAELEFQAGQPVMDRGIENAVLITLYTKPGWPGNALIDRPSQYLGGKFLEAVAKPVSLTAINDIRSAALSDLNWMIETKLAEEIDAIVTNPKSNEYEVTIAVKPPGSALQIVKITNNALLWIQQTIDPASGRL